ncbi:MAG TPA: hypothetical protein VIF15_00630 [Polyangiaceae bacterium]|jgi:hypothetical protein
MHHPADVLDDDGPSSEVRAIQPRARRLVVDTGLRGPAAEAAWVTVSGADEVVYFEGSPSADGCVEVSFDAAPRLDRARVMLETARLHRQKEITLVDGWNAYAFA